MRIVAQLWRFVFSFFVIVGLGFLASSSVRAASYTVTITQTQFVPGTLTVAVGDSITFINNTTATQSAKTSVASGFNTGDIGPSMSKQVTIMNEGTFTYSSLYNAALTGVVTVTGSGATLTTTTTETTTTAQTAVVSQTQEMPVSGTTENLIMLLAAGGVFVLAGGYAHLKRGTAASVVVNMPLVSSNHDQKPLSPEADQSSS